MDLRHGLVVGWGPNLGTQLGVSDHHVARYCIRSYALAGFRGTRWATLAMRSALSAASGEIEYGCRCNVGARAEDRTHIVLPKTDRPKTENVGFI